MQHLLRASILGSLILGMAAACGGDGDGGTSAEDRPSPSSAATSSPSPTAIIPRSTSIPAGRQKVQPADDPLPPVLHSDNWQVPVPLPYPVNTAGAEDSPFITPDGDELYFFFTPDPSVPAERQLVDGVTGIYYSRLEGDRWTEPVRLRLSSDEKELSLDGCEFVQGNVMWFCSVRVGNLREIDIYRATRRDGRWGEVENAGELLNVDYLVGELHLSADGGELYYHSDRPGGRGGTDIWLTRREGDSWTAPVNVAAVNTAETDGWPFVTEDGLELWFLRWYQGSPGIFRSRRSGANAPWGAPELILSQFAAEPSLDDAGNIYFVHHYIRDGVMIEADIYVAYRK